MTQAVFDLLINFRYWMLDWLHGGKETFAAWFQIYGLYWGLYFVATYNPVDIFNLTIYSFGDFSLVCWVPLKDSRVGGTTCPSERGVLSCFLYVWDELPSGRQLWTGTLPYLLILLLKCGRPCFNISVDGPGTYCSWNKGETVTTLTVLSSFSQLVTLRILWCHLPLHIFWPLLACISQELLPL